MSAIKAAQSAASALEGLQMSLILLANRLAKEESSAPDDSGCRHANKAEIQTMGDQAPAIMCMDCGLQLVDAMHHGPA